MCHSIHPLITNKMNIEELNNIIHFAEINGMMKWTFIDVLNEYFTTKEVAEDYEQAESTRES